MGFPGGSVGKESACSAGNARDVGSIPGLGRSPGGGRGSPLQYSCLENPMVRGGWQGTDHGVARIRHDLVTKPPSHNFKLTFLKPQNPYTLDIESFVLFIVVLGKCE